MRAMLRICTPAAALRGVLLGVSVVGLTACATTTPPAMVTPAPPPVTPPSLDTKVAWILRLEQQRVMRDPVPADAAPAAPAAGFRHAMRPDLSDLVADPDAVVRGRAAIAIGRVGLAEGVSVLQAALVDPAETVRGNAAFALGLLASRESVPAIQALLTDPSVSVRGRAVEALGLVGDPGAATAIVQAAAGCRALLPTIAPDDEAWPRTPEVELCRLSLYALVRLQDFSALAQVALDAGGSPVSSWWPVAYALQRIGDRRAIPALRTLASGTSGYSVSFALRGLAAFEDAQALPVARALAANRAADVKVRVAAVRLMARVGGAPEVATLTGLLSQEPSSSPLAIETVMALGSLRAPETFDVLVDGFTDAAPAMRAASLAAAARVDPETFLVALSGVPRDRDWSVRAALATVLGTLPVAVVMPALVDLSGDEDARVHSAALRALSALKVPDLEERLAAALRAEDFAERATAAELMGELKPADGAALLAAAYARGDSDSAYAARLAAVEAIASYGDAAVDTLRRALSDREWPVRVRAAALLRAGGVADAQAERPAPLRWPAAFFESDALLHPAYSPRAFVETRHGVIEVQLELVDAPLTVSTFVEQVRSGLFNGLRVHRLVAGFVVQTGDPRGDGTGGAGYTQRDEFSPRPFLRGTVGMAHAGPETAGSQWFIVTSPQPHLDAKYTAFGRVVGGWDVLDRLEADDVVERVRIWDGNELR
jgi:cyclophilin family peptidyl-prolyl cis-trans isomerase/HEAT repeat protein